MAGREGVPRLSKSRFLAGSQCHLRLWNDIHRRELAAPPDDVAQFIFNTGHEIGELACERYPGGRAVTADYLHLDDAIAETKRLIDEGASVLFEAAFEHRGVVARADILEQLPGGGWRMIEVKSTVGVKEVFIRDAAIQLWILRGAGLDVRDVSILTLDKRFVRTAAPPDPNALFRLHGVLEWTEAAQDAIGDDVRAMHAVVARPQPPLIETGDHCHTPYRCAYWAHCTRDAPPREHPLSELPRLRQAKRARLDALGIVEVREIPPDFPMSFTQHLVRRAVAQNGEIVRGDLAGSLAAIRAPIRHLDFETFAPAIPRFPGTRPYEGIPFLFSVHRERPGQAPEHTDYLHESADDPRPVLAERLLAALGTEGSICVYSRFERRVIVGLADALPQHAAALRRLLPRLVDMHRIVARHYYHPGFRGSYSLKAILPVLTSQSYEGLAITDGRLAYVRYLQALETTDEAARRKTFADLRAYCEQDTAATVAVLAALRKIAARHAASVGSGYASGSPVNRGKDP